VSKEFESQNSTSISFDPSNTATAQAFDGSNTAIQKPIDLSNSATTLETQNQITGTSPANATVTVSISSENETAWSELVLGDPLYYAVNVGSGFFQANPRGVVFIKSVDQIDVENNTATFQVSENPNGSAIPIVSNMAGYFKIANQARTFAGNNVNPETQIDLTVEVGQEFVFDGGNQGYDGAPASPPDNTSVINSYDGETITVFTQEGSLDYYVGAMLFFETDGTVPSGLSNNTTYFVTSFDTGISAGLFDITIAELPGGSNITASGGSGDRTFSKIGVSADKNIIHVKDSNFSAGDMLQYEAPQSGNAFVYDPDGEPIKTFFFVETAYGAHNYTIRDSYSSLITATSTGSTITTETYNGVEYEVHTFQPNQPTAAGRLGNSTFSFVVEDPGTFSQNLRVSVRNGSFDGITTEENAILPEKKTYTVVVSNIPQELCRVVVAYPKDNSTNNIPFNQISQLPQNATGGSISYISVNNVPYKVHTFTSTGTTSLNYKPCNVSGASNDVEYLVIAGGGGNQGGSFGSAGSGAGGYRTGNMSKTTAEDITVTVGAGGSGSQNGFNSVFSNITSIGGGRNGASGGSGGGAYRGTTTAGGGSGFTAGAAGTAGQGNSGGSANSAGYADGSAAGGGGAGGAGGNAYGYYATGSGGGGLSSSITGTSVGRAGGGGSRARNGSQRGGGGSGGGNPSSGSGVNGTGGGASGGTGSASGGSGIVVVRYPRVVVNA
jgi:hypothetical protein